MDQWCEDPKGPPRELYLKMGREGFLACLTGSKAFPRKWVDPGTPEPEDYDVFHEFILVDLLSQCGIPHGTVSHATRYHMRHGVQTARYPIRHGISSGNRYPIRQGIPPGTVSHPAGHANVMSALTNGPAIALTCVMKFGTEVRVATSAPGPPHIGPRTAPHRSRDLRLPARPPTT